ncbi:hypothetical protein ACFT38_09960 [Streptomyces sp. NPDC056975]|uniref:hypothetical protein n=1 Tax=Streptomyces sp. NPDC056975 TaxID=3345985 RepID=UPI003637C914
MPRLTLADLYAYHSVLAPVTETEAYLTQIDAWLGQGRRRKKGDATWSKGDLRVTVHHDDALPQDERADRDILPGFRPVDVVILSDEIEVSRTVRQLPWRSNRAWSSVDRPPRAGVRSVDVPGGRLAGWCPLPSPAGSVSPAAPLGEADPASAPQGRAHPGSAVRAALVAGRVSRAVPGDPVDLAARPVSAHRAVRRGLGASGVAGVRAAARG